MDYRRIKFMTSSKNLKTIIAIGICIALYNIRGKSVEANTYDETKTKMNGYTVTCRQWKYADTGTCVIFNSNEQRIAELNDIRGGFTTIRGDEVFWIFHPQEFSDSWTKDDELRITNLKAKETRTIYKAYGIVFRITDDGSLIAIHFNPDRRGFIGQVVLLNRVTGEEKTLLEPIERGYDLLGWSADGSKLWIGDSEAGGWTDLAAVSKNGQVTWFDEIRWSEDTILDYDLGWATYSDYPTFYDEASYEEYMKSKTKTTLWFYDLFNRKRVKVATGVINRFNPEWKKGPKGQMLVYHIGKKKFVVDPIELLKRKEKVP